MVMPKNVRFVVAASIALVTFLAFVLQQWWLLIPPWAVILYAVIRSPRPGRQKWPLTVAGIVLTLLLWAWASS